MELSEAVPTWWAWNDRCIDRLMRTIYQDQDLSLLAVLADALDDADYPDPGEALKLRALDDLPDENPYRMAMRHYLRELRGRMYALFPQPFNLAAAEGVKFAGERIGELIKPEGSQDYVLDPRPNQVRDFSWTLPKGNTNKEE
jgi:hypothetical protein